MGFGMVRKVYTRKPRKAFKKLRDTYGEEIANYRMEIQDRTVQPLTDQQRLILKQRIRDRQKAQRLRQLKIWGISLLLLLLFSVLFVRIFLWFFG